MNLKCFETCARVAGITAALVSSGSVESRAETPDAGLAATGPGVAGLGAASRSATTAVSLEVTPHQANSTTLLSIDTEARAYAAAKKHMARGQATKALDALRGVRRQHLADRLHRLGGKRRWRSAISVAPNVPS